MFSEKFLMPDDFGDKSNVDWANVFVYHISSHFST